MARLCYSSAYGCGAVFSITTAGYEKPLHAFKAYHDGEYPFAGLANVRGILYGTTLGGGKHHHGTVFSITPSGTEKVLYSFRGMPDGAEPFAGLIDVGGTLYGTTSSGGAYNCGSSSCGTVFSITSSGAEKVLHSFGNGTDGANPRASLIALKGTLYGTTEYGGAFGLGTVFSITPGGTETVLHSFNYLSPDGRVPVDGRLPVASLIKVMGTLYGTTSGGGVNNYGSVFSLKP